MQRILKRTFDLLFSIAVLIVLSPILVLTALLIPATSRGPVFFRQDRAGRNGDVFRLVKFRSMAVNEADPTQMGKVDNTHPLVTPIGSVIRRLKIDELPQLWNVLRGEMSVVGPRPALPKQVAEYDQRQRRRLDVKPGLTGWAQVNGNIQLTWDERITLDLWYIDNRSMWLDLRILWMTLGVIVRGERLQTEALNAARLHRRS